MKITKLKVLCGNDFQYFSEAIENNGRYYYRINNVTLEINEYEYNHVISNPYLYYFSTALKLHCSIENKKKELSKRIYLNLNGMTIEEMIKVATEKFREMDWLK